MNLWIDWDYPVHSLLHLYLIGVLIFGMGVTTLLGMGKIEIRRKRD